MTDLLWNRVYSGNEELSWGSRDREMQRQTDKKLETDKDRQTNKCHIQKETNTPIAENAPLKNYLDEV